jgi:hypothetical protein
LVRCAKLTWDYVTGIHSIIVLNEAKAIHEFDLGDLSSAMGSKVVLDINLGS